MGVKNIFALVTASLLFTVGLACSNGLCKIGDECSTNGDCEAWLYCFSCTSSFSGSRCKKWGHNNSLPFNKYAFFTNHNAFAIDNGVPRLTFTNQEDNITQLLNNGVHGLILDTYDFKGDVWLCHSSGGECHDHTTFEPAIDTLREIEAFLFANPSEIVTLILEDYVKAPNGLTKVFTDSGLMKYWFPLSKMPKNGQDWPLVKDMVANNQRLLVFTSIQSKEASEGIAYQWNYMVKNQYGPS
ncbi:PI-PLC X domain-containing protein At5g67130 [Olea europaea subsp. europaea]|uniref:PI-PLC X domain-containing protein At5g67130 n=1 Tax=Olea europaea subsp. europaea TaxID=158383 RepID=A0A8S0PX71_OLEEU|nr:PI-PLC X domain-containing protein At5g67130 [Olea europaea subsp. europaea]